MESQRKEKEETAHHLALPAARPPTNFQQVISDSPAQKEVDRRLGSHCGEKENPDRAKPLTKQVAGVHLMF